MAEMQRNNGNRKLSSRLQRRAPAALQISPVSTWNVAIPLLSPLVSSPPAIDLTAMEESAASRQGLNGQNNNQAEKPVVFKKWQHPAAPFYYEPAPLRQSSFVPV